jgi:hypothetical protein
MALKVKVMKGIISIPIGALVVTILLLLIIFAPIFLTTIHVKRIIAQEVSFNRAQDTLLALLSLTATDPLDNKIKPVYEIVAENISLTTGPDLEFLKSILDFYIPSKCFKLFYEKNGVKILLVEGRTQKCEFNQTVTTSIALPFGTKLLQNITLVVD